MKNVSLLDLAAIIMRARDSKKGNSVHSQCFDDLHGAME